MSSSKPLIIVLLGPTASGKTALGIEIAEHLGLEIHNVDSRQVYMDMDIGTAKPSQEQQKRIRHFLIDLKPPNEKMTMHDFHKTARVSLDNALNKTNVGLLVGGSGLYLKALTSGLCPPSIPPESSFRKQLHDIGQEQCYQLLQSCDPLSAKTIAPSDSVRTTRALEVFYATGQSKTSLQSSKPPPWRLLELGLNPSNLNDRIAQRTENIFQNGLIEETEHLIGKFGKELPLLNTIGYAEASQMIDGKLPLNDAIFQTNKRTKQFAKRQKTWFRGQHNPKWLNEKNPLSEALSLIHNVIR
ncbi:tRNA (adenosine(37)-N6)-dimethylallyltransferase MiaA [Prochlorococcus marinus]|uniref:tRNA dimethylallyltransferase n=1 Tax=Prochlorococcus marinus (strain MIT 9211) TaxID=93059 RepID=MIAA_PROM4|nr:tRNA (adenosine(37)-N6)-dimethylallyltransferase MiaA [Prochlorococcus marinus]A9BD80.1 RecName: Full=tRNA dimethylallyltransferase; AltName: Full=Dimethylallyl diphosphate:tRNA dimethylallyltransferase; Short=DMAPP:tRNA dimethylallyltransferase; Short=DMATase; AltName: Full=Isopentenyl-diphosphate:tRNA isopentenyltransferase; Short=IPP transferase; Short=IPPT; Short=IPTase [Prochlorococcus marinus str. MIT 9211]ABX09693.1 tRNA delta-2-isopentenylpyrophosphate (IPP) transferase [Prochlorococcu